MVRPGAPDLEAALFGVNVPDFALLSFLALPFPELGGDFLGFGDLAVSCRNIDTYNQNCETN